MTKRHRNKNGWKIEQFGKIWKKKKNQISSLFSTQTPPDVWPDALDRLTIGLVANKYTKLGKTSENLILSLGLSYLKIPLCYGDQAFDAVVVITRSWKLTSNDISNDLNDVLIYHIGKLIWYCTDPCYVFIHFTPIYCRQKSFFSCQFYFCTIGFMTKASRKDQKNITDDKKHFFFCHIAFFFLMTYYFDLTKQKSSNACEIRVQADPEEPGIWHYIHFDEIFVCSRCKIEKILKCRLDLIPTPLPSVKIQIMCRRVCLRCKGKTLLGDVNKHFVFKSLPYHLK